MFESYEEYLKRTNQEDSRTAGNGGKSRYME